MSDEKETELTDETDVSTEKESLKKVEFTLVLNAIEFRFLGNTFNKLQFSIGQAELNSVATSIANKMIKISKKIKADNTP